MTLRTTFAIAALALGVGGCVIDDDDDDRPSRPGELGAGDFLYVCVGDSDPFCTNGAVADTFPERIAVGARFDLDFNPNDNFFNDGLAVRIDAPNGSVVRTEIGAFFMQVAGYQVFLAVTNDSEVVDIQHLLAADIDRIAVRTTDSQDLDTIELAVGEQITVSAVPQDALRTTLAGSLSYTWTSADETIADIATVDEDFDITIEGIEVGSTTMVIETEGFVQEVTIEVTGESTTDDSTTGGEDTDGSSGTTGGEETSGSDTDEGSTGGEDTDGGTTDPTDSDTDTDTEGSTGT